MRIDYLRLIFFPVAGALTGSLLAQKPELVVQVGQTATIRSVSFSPNGQHVLTGSEDGTAVLWDLNGLELQRFSGHTQSVSSAIFSPDGQYVLTGSEDGTLISWDLNGQEFRRSNTHSNAVSSVAFSPDGTQILSGSWDKTAVLDGLNNRTIQQHSIGDGRKVLAAAFSPGGRHILIASDKTVALLDRSGRKLQRFRAGKDKMSSVAFSPDGMQILCGNDKSVVLWDLQGRELRRFAGHSDKVSCVSFSPDGQQILTGSLDGTATLWDLDGRKLRNFICHGQQVSSVAFSPDGRLILTGCRNGAATLWDLNGKNLQQFIGYSLEVKSVAFSKDSHGIITEHNNTAILWSLNTLNVEHTNEQTERNQADVFPPGEPRLLISTDGDRLYTDSSTVAKGGGRQNKPENKAITATSVYRDSTLGQIRIRRFSSLVNSVIAIAFSPDKKYILTGSTDQTSKLWDASTGKNLLTFIGFSDEDNSWMIVDPDQYYSVSSKGTGLIHFKIGLQAYSFDQFDLRLNRPDKVLETLIPLGADTNLIVQYRRAYYKRLEKYGFTEDMLSDDYHVPECLITNSGQLPISTMDGKVELQIEAVDSLRLLDRLNVYVNDVPIYGIQGIGLRDQNTQQYNTTLDIPLSRGSNKIQISALNQVGGPQPGYPDRTRRLLKSPGTRE
ncbi:MAG: WD40 repeat domain-containing protein [Lewinellaceae bacterium]|nr:WD40 repeat domain-containing protein [Lewinellaceae bacterium]